jgi:nitroimidazol reductase NimA-like FMN-containing flavoprotein (pyridoxamine 5'-phosphate oxidase superfamily)
MQDAGEADGRPTGEIINLSESECWELVGATTVGRLGFADGEEVQIIPVNYQLDDQLTIRTSSKGILSRLPGGPRIAFQVDYHGSSGAGWSVLMHGELNVITDDEAQNLHHRSRVLPWAGGERDLLLRFDADDIAGRRVRRIRNRPSHAPH